MTVSYLTRRRDISFLNSETKEAERKGIRKRIASRGETETVRRSIAAECRARRRMKDWFCEEKESKSFEGRVE